MRTFPEFPVVEGRSLPDGSTHPIVPLESVTPRTFPLSDDCAAGTCRTPEMALATATPDCALADEELYDWSTVGIVGVPDRSEYAPVVATVARFGRFRI